MKTNGKETVTTERWRYLGGSDVPVIMGISPFKTRWQLLQEKAQISENTFTGNEYTEYGDILEPKIRNFVNEAFEKNFQPDCIIHEGVRCNTDGWDSKLKQILEIKTTSHIKENVDDYKTYLVQLLFYMHEYGADTGYLAVYERPEDFNIEFNPLLCSVYEIHSEDYTDLSNDIYEQIERFRNDLAALRENPLLREEDLMPNELVEIANKVVEFERKLADMKQLEAQLKSFKEQLYKTMLDKGIKTWETNNGTKVTLVAPTESKFVLEFDEETFKKEEPEIYEYYLKNTTKKGRSGFVKVTLPKEK